MQYPKPQGHRIVLLGLAAVVLLLAVITIATPYGRQATPLGGDARYYTHTALNLVTRGVYADDEWIYGPTIFRPPLYSLWLAGAYRTVGASELAIRLLQILLHGAGAYAVFVAARRYVDERTGIVASLAYAAYLPSYGMSLHHLSEALACPLAAIAVATACPLKSRPSVGNCILAGVVVGAAALTRSILLVLALIPLIHALAADGKAAHRAGRAAWVLAGLLLTLSPWLAYTHQMAGKPSLGLSGCAAWISAMQYKGGFSYVWTDDDWARLREDWPARVQRGITQADPASPTPVSVQGELYADATWKADAAQLMRGVPPVTLLRHLPVRVRWLWSHAYMGPPQLRIPAVLQWLIYVLLAVVGLIAVRRSAPQLWALIYVPLVVTLAHFVFLVEPRYSLLAWPCVSIFTAVGALRIWDLIQRPAGARLRDTSLPTA